MKKRGRGMACMFYPVGMGAMANATTAVVKVNHDGTATVFVGPVDEGQGSNTVLAQMVAEALGIPLSTVRLVTADTELTPYDAGTGASRVTYVAGNAVTRAAMAARGMLLKAAAGELGRVDPATLECVDGKIYAAENPDRWVGIAQAAWRSERIMGQPVIAVATYNPSTTDFDEKTGQGTPFEVYNYATQIAEVEVDTETGEVQVLKLTAVHDCGRAINPLLAEGQVHGGVVMGYGYALLEEIWTDPGTGRVVNDSFTDYLLPTAVDSPGEINVSLLEEESKVGPFGAKGLGEPTALPTAPAICNAIYDAVGIRVYDLPATPEKVFRLLRSKASSS